MRLPLPRRGPLALALVPVLAVAACAPGYPPRGGDIDLAGEPIACPDFRTARLWTPWQVFEKPALSGQWTPLGCTTARSLRAMANPSDLAGGETGPARSAGAAPGVQRYTDGEVKAPPRINTLAGSE